MDKKRVCGCHICKYGRILSPRIIRRHLVQYGTLEVENRHDDIDVDEGCGSTSRPTVTVRSGNARIESIYHDGHYDLKGDDCDTDSDSCDSDIHWDDNTVTAGTDPVDVSNSSYDVTSCSSPTYFNGDGVDNNDIVTCKDTAGASFDYHSSEDTVIPTMHSGPTGDMQSDNTNDDSENDESEIDEPTSCSNSDNDLSGSKDDPDAKCEWSCDYDRSVYDSDIAEQTVTNDITVLQWLALNFHLFVCHPSMSKSAFSHNLEIQGFLQKDKGHLLPCSYYEARKMIKPFVIKKKIYDVCTNDCVIFRGEYLDMQVCPMCKEERYIKTSTRHKKTAKRKFIYIPIGPRIARIFGEANLAQLVQSHPGYGNYSEQMWDVQDSPAWQKLYSTDGYFKGDKMGLSFAMELDGVNPYHNIGVQYSMTPIMLTLLNLPRHIRNSFGHINLVGIIPGNGTSEAKNIDPYVDIVVDELLFLSGCKVFNAYKKAPVDVKTKLLFFVLDYPGFSKLFHQHGSGALSACHWCTVKGKKCTHLDKVIYLSNRSFLDVDDPIRHDSKSFLGKAPDCSDRPTLRVQHDEISYRKAYEGAKNKTQSSLVATATGCKSSYPILKLPGHDRIENTMPDACHTIKDVKQNIMNVITGNKKVDLQKIMSAEKEFGRENGVHLPSSVDTLLPATDVEIPSEPVQKKQKLKKNIQKNCSLSALDIPCVLTKNERKIADERAKNIRVPQGYGLKPSGFITNSGSLKSHDWKQLATQGILKFCLKGCLSKQCRHTLFMILDCMSEICREVVTKESVGDLKHKLNKALALLERDFPLSIQNITTHILHHIPDGIEQYGPVYGTWMYVFERFNSWICKRALNKRYPEATVIETFLIHDWCNFMISTGRLPLHVIRGSSMFNISEFLDETNELESKLLSKKVCVWKKRELKSIHNQCNEGSCDGSCSVSKYYRHNQTNTTTKRNCVYNSKGKELVTARTMSSFVSAEFARGSQEQKLLSGKFLYFGRIGYFVEHVNGNTGKSNTLACVEWFDNIHIDYDTGLWYTKLHAENHSNENKSSFVLTKCLSDPVVTVIENDCLWFLTNSHLDMYSGFSYMHTDRM